MTKIKLLFLLILISLVAFSQEQEIVALKKSNYEIIKSRKGQFFASWGWNRSSYSKSDITFKGNNFNFTLNNVKADDKPKPFGARFLDPGGITLPQTNFEFGYFIKDNYNIVIGYDHMKYVMRQDQFVEINGNINTGTYDFEGYDLEGNEITVLNQNFDGNYQNETIQLIQEFILFEHTDGLNYVFVGANRYDNLNKLLHINNANFQINIEEGFDVGVLFPKTNATVLGNERYDDFDISGFGLSASAGLNLTFFKRFFIKADFKVGYINMPDIVITKDASGKAKQHFMFAESAYTFGYRFNIK